MNILNVNLKSKKIAIVIPVFNRKKITEKCVRNLLSGTYKDIDIILCDSGSSDGTAQLNNVYPDIKIINLDTSAWWTEAVNCGISSILKTDLEHIVILNDDIDFSSTLIEQLYSKSVDNPNKIISPSQESAAGIFLGMKYTNLLKLSQSIYDCDANDDIDVQTSNGCCLLIPREVFNKIGLFDSENCPHLAADAEFQIRALRAGYRTRAIKTIRISQQPNTDYFKNIKLKDIFSGKGSPLNLKAYLKFQHTLFGSWFKFLLFGFIHNYYYVRSLIKAVYLSLRYQRF